MPQIVFQATKIHLDFNEEIDRQILKIHIIKNHIIEKNDIRIVIKCVSISIDQKYSILFSAHFSHSLLILNNRFDDLLIGTLHWLWLYETQNS